MGGNCRLLFKGTPEIREHYLDSKKDVDHHLKSACEHFIQQQTAQFVEPLELFTAKVRAARGPGVCVPPGVSCSGTFFLGGAPAGRGGKPKSQ